MYSVCLKTNQSKETSKDVLQLLGVISRIFQDVLEMTLNSLQFVYFAIPCKCLFNYILPIKSSLMNVSFWHISQHSCTAVWSTTPADDSLWLWPINFVLGFTLKCYSWVSELAFNLRTQFLSLLLSWKSTAMSCCDDAGSSSTPLTTLLGVFCTSFWVVPLCLTVNFTSRYPVEQQLQCRRIHNYSAEQEWTFKYGHHCVEHAEQEGQQY